MCGLTGVLAENLPPREVLWSMTSALRHRGPDDGDVWCDAAAGIALGHRRLIVLDPSPTGHQPMPSACGRYVLAFNGEIYNHLELRKELEQIKRAPPWRGRSDTETLLACFTAWGVMPSLERTVGMFAIALWDRQERRLYLARDRMGEKPLYYGWTRNAFVFGSELQALRAHPEMENPIDRDVLALYMQFSYVPTPYSIFRQIYKLQPGCVLSLSLAEAARPPARALFAPARHHGLALEPYWSLATICRQGLSQPLDDERVALEQLEASLSQAIRLQSVADVPVGAFLSGGIDSSIVVALMQAQATRPVRTFTIGSEDATLNEAPYAKSIARHLGTDHTELIVSSQQARDVIPTLPKIYREPFADPSQIPTTLVAQLARGTVTVALSGDGGDELFGGYTRYLWGPRITRYGTRLPLLLRRSLSRGILSIPIHAWNSLAKTWSGNLGAHLHKLATRLQDVRNVYRSLATEWTNSHELLPGSRALPTLLDDPSPLQDVKEEAHRMMIWDALTYLPDDILHKVDRASMAVSLETRAPFLDHRVVGLAWRLPLSMKIHKGRQKWLLRQLLYRYVPRNVIDRPKRGFAVPLGAWLRGPLRDWTEHLLSSPSDCFRSAPTQEKWRLHLTGRHDCSTSLWPVLMFQAWLEANR